MILARHVFILNFTKHFTYYFFALRVKLGYVLFDRIAINYIKVSRQYLLIYDPIWSITEFSWDSRQ